jgi:transposase-like protein
MSDDSAQYTADEQRAIRQSWIAGDASRCPRCDTPMTVRRIGGGSFGLGYARRREWLICPTCHRSAIFDAKRGTRN